MPYQWYTCTYISVIVIRPVYIFHVDHLTALVLTVFVCGLVLISSYC